MDAQEVRQVEVMSAAALQEVDAQRIRAKRVGALDSAASMDFSWTLTLAALWISHCTAHSHLWKVMLHRPDLI